jgi:hypothetical protein
MTNLIVAVGELAGKVWRHLAAEGEQPLSQVAVALGEPDDRVTLAVGWLAREGKILLRSESGAILIALKEPDENW